MIYQQYKSPKGNFGDDLNGWLWPKLFGPENLNDEKIFLGIGSIISPDVELFKNLPPDKKKIIFGSGVRYSYNPIIIDNSFEVFFFRGPLSSSIFNNEFEFIADAAYAMALLPDYLNFKQIKKKHKISLMPYFATHNLFDWKKLCKELNFNYISPLAENGINYTLEEIASSEFLISEAMHGAIVADVLRVPWSRIISASQWCENSEISEFKWLDWQFAIEQPNLKTIKIDLYKKTPLNKIIRTLSLNNIDVKFRIKPYVYSTIREELLHLNTFYMSDQNKFEEIIDRIAGKAEILKKALS
jgi:succinoglycan biosynthesis protein ExoV